MKKSKAKTTKGWCVVNKKGTIVQVDLNKSSALYNCWKGDGEKVVKCEIRLKQDVW